MVKKIFLGIVIVLVVMQFFGGGKNEAVTHEVSAFINETKPNQEIQAILTSQCFDCHSNKTTYPWYAKIAPVSFWINHHVEEGKEHLNFSAWDTYDAKKKKHKLHEVEEEVEEGKMPLNSYENMHGELSKSERELLVAWAKEAMSNY